jgi:hypothetical protein
MAPLGPHFCTKSSWDTMPEEAKRQMVVLAASMLPAAGLAPMQPYNPNRDGPFGEPFTHNSQRNIDPELNWKENA